MVVKNTKYERGTRRERERPRCAAIYTRVSDPTEEHNEFSHLFQERACRVKAAELGYTEVRVFADNFSGRYLHERPALAQLRQAARDGAVSAVIVWKLDRFSRRQAQRAIIVQELRQFQCEVISATEDIKDTPDGRLLEAMLGAIAEFEVERTLERSQASIAEMRDQGLLICGGDAKYGYRYDSDARTRIIIEEEARWVREIFQWYLEGLSCLAIARRLDAIPVPCPALARGRKTGSADAPRWGRSTVRSIIRDESYCGAPMTSGKWRATGDVTANGHGRVERTDPAEWWQGKDPTPAIVDRATWERAQEQLHQRGNRLAPASATHLLSGHVRCAVCRRAMVAHKTRNPYGKHYYYFECTSKNGDTGPSCGNKGTPMAWLEQVVWDAVVAHITDRQVIQQRFEQIAREHQLPDRQGDRAAHERAIDEARAGIRRLTVRLEATDDPELVGPWEARLVELRETIRTHQREIEEIDAKLCVARNQQASLERWWTACQRGREQLAAGTLSFEQKRLLLESLGLLVKAKRREIVIGLGIPESGEFPIVESSARGSLHGDKLDPFTFEFALTG